MTPTPPVAVTIRVGDHKAHVPLVALAAVFHVAPAELHAKLVNLVESIRRRLEGEPTEGEADRSIPKGTTEIPRSIEGNGGVGERGSLSAEALARVLGDDAGVAALRKLVQGAAPELVELALTRTLALPAERIERSRAAYFSTVLRGLLRAPPRSSPRPYA